MFIVQNCWTWSVFNCTLNEAWFWALINETYFASQQYNVYGSGGSQKPLSSHEIAHYPGV